MCSPYSSAFLRILKNIMKFTILKIRLIKPGLAYGSHQITLLGEKCNKGSEIRDIKSLCENVKHYIFFCSLNVLYFRKHSPSP